MYKTNISVFSYGNIAIPHQIWGLYSLKTVAGKTITVLVGYWGSGEQQPLLTLIKA
jgi:hypothetical protein